MKPGDIDKLLAPDDGRGPSNAPLRPDLAHSIVGRMAGDLRPVRPLPSAGRITAGVRLHLRRHPAARRHGARPSRLRAPQLERRHHHLRLARRLHRLGLVRALRRNDARQPPLHAIVDLGRRRSPRARRAFRRALSLSRRSRLLVAHVGRCLPIGMASGRFRRRHRLDSGLPRRRHARPAPPARSPACWAASPAWRFSKPLRRFQRRHILMAIGARGRRRGHRLDRRRHRRAPPSLLSYAAPAPALDSSSTCGRYPPAKCLPPASPRRTPPAHPDAADYPPGPDRSPECTKPRPPRG